MKKRTKVIISVIVLILLISIGGVFLWLNDYYEANEEVLDILENENVVYYEEQDIIVFNADEDNDLNKAFVFYPGGKVDYKSYIPLLNDLAEEGLTTAVVKMPFNLAVLDINAALDVFPLVEEIEDWYIGGHSLGGAMASGLISENENDLLGLILLAAYPTEDIDKPIISIYGTNDKVLDKSKIDGGYKIIKIEGGNHAYFGNYGEQEGDGEASISRKEQQGITIDAIMDFVEQR